jgi:2-phosphosulfolactate phosphatase
MTSPYVQDGHQVRFDWGPAGARVIGRYAQLVAFVDVLSFTTTLNVAVERDIAVYPYRWRDETAVAYARDRRATLAVGRSEVTGPGQVSLSPSTIRDAIGLERLVLPSPNGSAIAHDLATAGASVIGVCLRNFQAAARWTAHHHNESVIAVVAAGERWPDGTLRPAVEDLWGAGAYISALFDQGISARSPEADAAVAAYGNRTQELTETASGRELIAYGHPDDVAVAAELNASTAVPLLDGECFRRA